MRTRGTARTTRILLAVCVVGTLVASVAPAATAGSRTRDRDGMYHLTNNSRTHRSLRGLALRGRMSELARRHSVRMAARGDLFHTPNPAKTYLSGRRWRIWGENVGVTGGSLSDLQRAFMNSSHHRSNILHRGFRSVAVGVAEVNGVFWVTVFFYG